jgi:TOM7 family
LLHESTFHRQYRFNSAITMSNRDKFEALAWKAFDHVGVVAKHAFHYGYVPLIFWLGSKSTPNGLLEAIFPAGEA